MANDDKQAEKDARKEAKQVKQINRQLRILAAASKKARGQ